MYKTFKSKHIEGMTAEKSYSYSNHYLLLDSKRTVLCQVPCIQIEGSSGKGTDSWEEVLEDTEYTERTFTLDQSQMKKFEVWRKKKNKKKGAVYVGAIGGAYTFCFTPTGLGTITVVKCADGTELDITDEDEFS